MAGIRAITPTSAGLAQVFDVSSYRDEEMAKRAKMEEKLNQTRLQYDPKGLYKEDIPAYQQLMEEYQKFVADNHAELANSGENMAVWRRKQDYENEIKNFVAGSMGKNSMYLQYINRAIDDPKYQNKENTDFAAQAKRGITLDEYRKGDLGVWNVGMDNLKRNINFDAFSAAKEVFATIGKSVQNMAGLKSELAKGRNFYDVLQEIQYDPAMLDDKLEQIYTEASERGRDLQYQYKSFDEFKEAMIPALIRQSSQDLQSFNLGGGGDGAAKGVYSATMNVGSTTTLWETEQEMQDIPTKDMTGKERRAMKEKQQMTDVSDALHQYNLGTVNRATTESGQTKAITSGGQVLKLDGMNLSIITKPEQGMNLQTGKQITPEEAQIYQSAKVTEIGNYWRAKQNIPIKLDGANGSGRTISVEKGTFMPDIEAMYQDKMISQNTRDNLMKYNQGKLLERVEGAVLQADPEEMNIFQKAEGMSYSGTTGQSKGGKSYVIVPLSTVKASINSAINTKYTELAELSGGDPVDYYMQANNIKLDDSFLDFWGADERLYP